MHADQNMDKGKYHFDQKLGYGYFLSSVVIYK